ncbi:MAG: FAD-dependent monooxygenase [Armatimonadota bacterium]|nr:FAD-dependent monooxygenase [Armatimonadota bacterium]
MRIAVIGGGPAGLFFAALVRRADPDCQVTVYERNPPDATYGFGVVFPERSLRYLREADPDLHAAFTAQAVQWEDIAYGHRGASVRFGGHVFSGIARAALLRLLRERAAGLGADLRFQVEAPPLAALADADLIVAADGAGSAARTALADALGASVHTGRSRFIWLGTTKVFDALTFLFAENAHGWWGIHAYPYSDTHSTVIVETDEATWRRAGLDRADEIARAAGAPDLASVRYCEALFAPFLDGAPLLANNSRWATFRTVRCRRWHAGRVVLLGDAAHTAHFSVGSGTRMAMEDAIALAQALGRHATLAGALKAYERERQPAVARLQQAAEPSRWWWEHFRWFAGAPPARFSFHHLSRAPLLSYGALVVRDRRAVGEVARVVAAAGGRPDAPPYAQPLVLEGLRLRTRIVAELTSGPDAPHRAGAVARDGAGLVLADAPADWRQLAEAVHAAGSCLGVRVHVAYSEEDERPHAAHSSATTRRPPYRLGSGDDADHAASAALDRTDPCDIPQRLAALAEAGVDLVVLDGPVEVQTVRAARGAWPAGRPLAVVCRAWRDPRDDDEVARGLDRARALQAAGCGLVVVVPPPRAAARTVSTLWPAGVAQVFTSDLLRHAVGIPTALVGGQRSVGDVTAALLAGRADLCSWPSLAWPGWRPDGA